MHRHRIAFTALPVALTLAVAHRAAADGPSGGAPAGDKAQAQLDQDLPELRFNGNALSDVVDFLRDMTGANVYVDWKGLARIGVGKDAPVTIHAKDVKLRDALATICKSAGKDDAHHPVFGATKGFIKIGPPAQTKGRAPATRP